MNAYGKALTPEELKTVHNVDRILYRMLAFGLRLEPHKCRKLLAFLNWLESCGYSKVVYKMIQMPNSDLWDFARVATFCVKYLFGEVGPEQIADIEAQTRKSIPMILGQDFSHWLLYENREMAVLEMTKFIEDVCTEDFIDFSDLPSLSAPLYYDPNKMLPPFVLAQRYHMTCFHTKGLQELQDISTWRHSKKERTLVVTFFNTHPVSRDELFHIFARQHGARVWAINMKEDGRQNNYERDVILARVVLDSREEIKKILPGNEKDGVFCSRSGRTIMVRRFVTLKEANDLHKSDQINQ